MERFFLCRLAFRHRHYPDHSTVTVFQQNVRSRDEDSYGFSFGHLQKSLESFEQSPQGDHSGRDSEFDVRRRSEVHRSDRLHQHDLVGASADRFGVVLLVEYLGALGVGGVGCDDHFDSRQRVHREQSQSFANQTDEKQGRKSQVDERGPERNQSAQVVRLGAKF